MKILDILICYNHNCQQGPESEEDHPQALANGHQGGRGVRYHHETIARDHKFLNGWKGEGSRLTCESRSH